MKTKKTNLWSNMVAGHREVDEGRGLEVVVARGLVVLLMVKLDGKTSVVLQFS